MKKILLFVIVALAFVGLAGGIGYTAMHGAYVITVGVAVLGYLAFFKAKEYISRTLS